MFVFKIFFLVCSIVQKLDGNSPALHKPTNWRCFSAIKFRQSKRISGKLDRNPRLNNDRCLDIDDGFIVVEKSFAVDPHAVMHSVVRRKMLTFDATRLKASIFTKLNPSLESPLGIIWNRIKIKRTFIVIMRCQMNRMPKSRLLFENVFTNTIVRNESRVIKAPSNRRYLN